MGFQQGLSGLNVSSKNLDVIGNNVANSNTVGFKSGQAQFADVFAASLAGAGTLPVGLGAKMATVAQQFTQGNVTSTNNPLDVAINGGGFFIVSQPNTQVPYYTRNGQFSLDSTNHIVTNEGYRLQGYPTDSAGNILVGSTPQDMTISKAKINPLATGTSALAAGVLANINLDSRDPVISSSFDYTNPSTYNRSTALSIYDSLGNPHTYTMYFQKTGVNAWNVYTTVTNPSGAVPAFVDTSNPAATTIVGALATATTPAAAAAAVNATAINNAITAAGGTLSTPTSQGNLAVAAASTAAAATGATVQSVINAAIAAATPVPHVPVETLTFSSSGILTSTPQNQTLTSNELGFPGGVNQMVFPVNFTGSTQFGSSFAVNSLQQDGFTSGELAGFNVGPDGVIKGRYTNGQTKNLGQISLANFANPQGLEPLGNNRWAVTSASGVALLNTPGAGGNGVLQSASVEDSNVDLTQELVNMITAQRVYQANAQTIKTQDQVLQTLVNLR